jgi:hypothetical protein
MRKALLMVMVFALALSTIPLYNAKAQETFLWGADVFSSGVPVTSPVLEAGRQYRIVAKEIFHYNTAASLAADAMYYTDSPPTWDWINHFPAPDGHSFLQIDGMDVDWGPFSNGDTGHTYSIYYTGTGAAIAFRLVDWIDGNYGNNYCHLPVEIYEQPPPPPSPGLTPGFWKNNLAVYLGLANGNRGYSDPTGSPTVTKDTMGDFFDSLAGTYDLNQLYRELCPQLDGTTADIRNAAANIFNVAAGLSPGPPWV